MLAGNLEAANLLFDAGKYHLDAQMWNCFHAAAVSGSTEVLEWLVEERTPDIDARNGSGATPLLVAAANGCRAFLQHLVAMGVTTEDG